MLLTVLARLMRLRLRVLSPSLDLPNNKHLYDQRAFDEGEKKLLWACVIVMHLLLTYLPHPLISPVPSESRMLILEKRMANHDFDP